ncbi:hypothetical protein [Pseudoxanthomonas spadix]|uniref:hypothetical protein n=1 Tax=Pseudoxanthomonas spadix TaxID=415229 RepID=UPI001930BF56|nr:hypothetical protein [Pseudoxanthomonas spadix]
MKHKARSDAGLVVGAPGTGALLEVQVLPQVDHDERSEAQLHEGDRVWEGSVERSCEPMNKNRIEGAAEQGERARNREALVIKARWRRSGGCAAKECVLTRGDLALRLTSPKGAGQPSAGPERGEGCAQRTKGDGHAGARSQQRP